MWKSVVGHNVNVKADVEGDDWETDPDFENDVSEQEQRWGAKTIEGSGRQEAISVAELRQNVSREHEKIKQKELSQAPKASYGYGGKFGVEKDRMDKVAKGHDYVAEVEQHSSQKDAAKGFGGKFGVQKDRIDKSAMGYQYKGEVEQHSSQKDYAKGFGGKYGVEKEKVDKAALGYDYKGETEKHQSQKDYSKGFGGKFGVEKEKVDKAALGYDYKGETEKHQSQKDYSKGFGGRYGVQEDRMDKSAVDFTDMESPTSAYEKTQPLEASGAGAGNLRARFENMAKASDEENKKKAEEERSRRLAREKKEREEARERREREEAREKREQEEAREKREREEAKEKREQEEEARRRQEEDSREETVYPPPAVPNVDAEDRKAAVYRPLPQTPAVEPDQDEEPLYDEPPCLPPRSDEFQDQPQAFAPQREEPDEDYENIAEDGGEYVDITEEAEYEDIGAIPPPPVDTDNDYEDLSGGQTAVALYDYQGGDDDEISFNVDDIITNIEMVDEGWWKGHCHGAFGLFPAAFVKLQ